VRADAVVSGISHGTELALYRGVSAFGRRSFDLELRLFLDGPAAAAYPMRLGYEWVGTVREVGEEVETPAIGDLVQAALPHRETQTFSAEATPPPWSVLPATLTPERATSLLARDRGDPQLAFQFLVYPPLDHRPDTPSRREMADPLFFDRDDIAWCWRHYLRAPADGDDPLASPLRAADLSGLPPALVITAERDPLRDEAELYAARLADSGVPTELVRFDGMVHGFFSLIGVVDAAAEAQELTAAALRRALLPGYAPS
jgi:hypothetical protein